MTLDGKAAIVTGASRGIGKATALRLGADIAAVVRFLAGEDARWVTGQTIYADGGYA